MNIHKVVRNIALGVLCLLPKAGEAQTQTGSVAAGQTESAAAEPTNSQANYRQENEELRRVIAKLRWEKGAAEERAVNARAQLSDAIKRAEKAEAHVQRYRVYGGHLLALIHRERQEKQRVAASLRGHMQRAGSRSRVAIIPSGVESEGNSPLRGRRQTGTMPSILSGRSTGGKLAIDQAAEISAAGDRGAPSGALGVSARIRRAPAACMAALWLMKSQSQPPMVMLFAVVCFGLFVLISLVNISFAEVARTSRRANRWIGRSIFQATGVIAILIYMIWLAGPPYFR